MKAQDILLLLLHFAQLGLAAGAASEESTGEGSESLKVSCHVDILRSYMLHGRTYSLQDKMVTCPEIKNNCCTKLDQQRIFHSVNDIMPERLSGYQSRIWFTMAKLKKLHKTILKHKPKFTGSPKRRMFCSTEAQRVYNFDFANFYDQLHHAMDDSQYELGEIYKSFFCNICDGDNQPYFSHRSKQITVNAEFCQNLIKQHEESLQMINVDLVNYLVSLQHLVDCNHYLKTYNLKFFDGKKQKFADEVMNCINNAGSKLFMRYCQSTCNQLTFSKVNFLFEGDYEFMLDAANLFEKFFEFKETGHFMSMKLRLFFKKFKVPRMLHGEKRKRFIEDLKNRQNSLFNRKLTVKKNEPRSLKLKLPDVEKLVETPDESVQELNNLPRITEIKNVAEKKSKRTSKNKKPEVDEQETTKSDKGRILDSTASTSQIIYTENINDRFLADAPDKNKKAELVSSKELKGFYTEINIEKFSYKKYIFQISPAPIDLDSWSKTFISSDGLNPEKYFGTMLFGLTSNHFYHLLFDYRKPDIQDAEFLMFLSDFNKKYFLEIEKDIKKRFILGKKKKRITKLRVLETESYNSVLRIDQKLKGTALKSIRVSK